jgi:hypothetical protein
MSARLAMALAMMRSTGAMDAGDRGRLETSSILKTAIGDTPTAASNV